MTKLKGQVIKISPSSSQYINPMDINSNYSEEDNPIALKADFILSLCELVVGGKDGLQPVEKTVIDRCVHQIYQKYFNDPRPENMPILQDLYEALLKQEEKEAHHVATALEIYVTGSLNLFNHRTNVDIENRLVCYDIKELGKQMKKIGMLVVHDQSGDGSLPTGTPEKPHGIIWTNSTSFSGKSRRRRTRWKSGSGSGNGAASPQVLLRILRISWQAGRLRIFLRTVISFIC